MLYGEIIAVRSEIHTKHKYTVWAEHRIFLMLNRVIRVREGDHSEEVDGRIILKWIFRNWDVVGHGKD